MNPAKSPAAAISSALASTRFSASVALSALVSSRLSQPRKKKKASDSVFSKIAFLTTALIVK